MPPVSKPSVLRVRTFADDLRRAEGSAPVHTPLPPTQAPAETQTRSVRILAPTLSEALKDHVAPQTKPEAPPVPKPTTPPVAPATLQHEQGAFDIRHEETHSVGDATIINDRRASKWSFLEEIQKSAQAWWQDVQEHIAESKKAGHAKADIAPPSKRQKTIVAAEAFTVAPKDDHRALAEKLRTITRTPNINMSGVILQQVPPARTTPSWRRISEPRVDTAITHTTPEELRTFKEDLKRALPEQKDGDRERQSLKVARPPMRDMAETTSIHGDVIAKDPSLSVAPRAQEPGVMQELANARARLQALTTSAKHAQEVPVPEKRVSRDIPFIPPAFTHVESAPIRTYRNDALSDIQSRQLSKPQIATQDIERRQARGEPALMPKAPEQQPSRLLPILGVVTVLILLGIGGTMLYPILVKETPVETVSGIPAFFRTDVQNAFPLGTDRQTLLATLNTKRLETPLGKGSFLQLYGQVAENNSERIARTSDFMRVLDPRVPGAFTRTLTEDMMVGSYSDTRAPFIIFKTTDFTTAFAGMLAWEDMMSIDLAPFFGGPVRRSFDQNALTVDQTRPARFVDIVLENADVRALYDEFGEERILYAFPDTSTIVITTNAEALTSLLKALK